MLHVLWFALILNSIYLSKQVFLNNLRPKTINPYTTLNQRIKSYRKQLRTDDEKLRKSQIAEFGYDDISEPLNYNYKEVWWTTDFTTATNHIEPSEKVRIYHKKSKEVTKPLTKFQSQTMNLSPSQNTSKIYNSYTLRNRNTVAKVSSRTMSDIFDILNNTLPKQPDIFRIKSNTRSVDRTTKDIKFVDKEKGIYLPILRKDDKGEFSIIANETNLLVKRNENDSNLRGDITGSIFFKDMYIRDFDYMKIYPDDDPRNPMRKPKTIEIVRDANVVEEIKKRPAGSNIILVPGQSKVVPNIEKDGIYRIEIPKPVTRKVVETSIARIFNDPQFIGNKAILDRALKFHGKKLRQGPGDFKNSMFIGSKPYATGLITNNYVRNGPYYNRQYPNYGTNFRPYRQPMNSRNPVYNQQRQFHNPPNSIKQQRPFFNQNQAHRPRPYNSNNFNQHSFYNFNLTYNQSPFYSPQNSLYNQRPLYNANNMNRQLPYNTNYSYNQGPFNSSQNPDPNTNRQNFINSSPDPRNIKHHNTTKNLNNTQGTDPSNANSLEGRPGFYKPERQAQTTRLKIHLSKPKVTLAIVAQDSVTIPTTEASTYPDFHLDETPPRPTYFYEDGGPIKDNAPIRYDEHEIDPLSPYVAKIVEEMKSSKNGYFSLFFIKLLEILHKKKDADLSALLFNTQVEYNRMSTLEHLIHTFGQDFERNLEQFTLTLDRTPADVAKTSIAMLHYTLINRKEGVTKDINSLIDYIDSLYEDYEGIELFKVLEQLEKFPEEKFDMSVFTKALFAPASRLSGTTKKQILIDSINKVIENHSIPSIYGVDYPHRRRKGISYSKSLRFLKSEIKNKHTRKANKKIKEDGRYFLSTSLEDEIKSTVSTENVKDVLTDESAEPKMKKYDIINHLSTRLQNYEFPRHKTPTKTIKHVFTDVISTSKHKKYNDHNYYTRLLYYDPAKGTASTKAVNNTNSISNNINIDSNTGTINYKKATDYTTDDDFLNQSTRLLFYEPSRRTASTFNIKNVFTDSMIKNTKETIDFDINPVIRQEENMKRTYRVDKMAINFKMTTTAMPDAKTYFFQPFTVRTTRNAKLITNFRPKNTLNPKNKVFFKKYQNKIDKLKEILAEHVVKMKADKTFRKITNGSIVGEADPMVNPIEISSQKPATQSLKPELHKKVKKTKTHKHIKTPHFHRKEIKHLKRKHPKIYKKYLRHLEKVKLTKKHKRKSHRHKKNYHHTKKRKHSKMKKLERHYMNKIKKYRLKKPHPKARFNESSEKDAVDDQIKDGVEFDTNEYSYLYDLFKRHKDQNIGPKMKTTPHYAFVTPPNNIVQHVTTNQHTEKWFHVPIDQTAKVTNFLARSNNNVLAFDKSSSKDSSEVSEESLSNKNPNINIIKKSSSYSDEENALKNNLFDALRHDKEYLKPQRRSFNIKPITNQIRSLSSYSSEEIVLKSKIYKAAGFYNSRANFSEVFKQNGRKNNVNFRRNKVRVNDITSYSDEEEILKQKIRI